MGFLDLKDGHVLLSVVLIETPLKNGVILAACSTDVRDDVL